LIHTTTPLLSSILFFIGLFLKRPIIATNLSYFLNKWQKIVNNYLKAKLFEIIEFISYKLPYSFLISVSPKFIELVNKYGIKTPIVHIPNAVDFEIFNPNINSEKMRKKYLPLSDRYLISFIGRLVPQKGVDVLIKAIPQINTFFKNCIYLIVGNGNHRKKLESLVRTLNVKNVVFTGAVQHSRIPEFISASDIIILPSLGAEGRPRVILEAMACGKSIVATKVGGIKDLIIDGKTGFLVEEGNAQKIAEMINSLLKNKKLREEIGKNAYKFIKNKFTWERVGNETLRIYNKAISSYMR
jgi:glycosyltransferase involved in cell wall biosynthesis